MPQPYEENSRCFVSLHQVHQRAESNAGWTLGQPGLGVVIPRGARDVEVDPRRIAREFSDEPGASDRAAALAASDVLNVRKTALDLLAIVVVHRHLPHFFARRFGRCQQLVCKLLI